MTSPWVDGEELTAAIMYARITARLNALPLGFISDNNSSGSVTLATTSAFAGLGAVTFTLTSQRLIRIFVNVRYNPAGATTARYQTKAGYNSGGSASIGSFTQVGAVFDVINTTAQQCSGTTEGEVSLPAGTYTAYASVTRIFGGAAGDSVGNPFYTAVYDVGAG